MKKAHVFGVGLFHLSGGERVFHIDVAPLIFKGLQPLVVALTPKLYLFYFALNKSRFRRDATTSDLQTQLMTQSELKHSKPRDITADLFEDIKWIAAHQHPSVVSG